MAAIELALAGATLPTGTVTATTVQGTDLASGRYVFSTTETSKLPEETPFRGHSGFIDAYRSGTNFQIQVFWSYTSVGTAFVRRYASGSWGAWTRFTR